VIVVEVVNSPVLEGTLKTITSPLLKKPGLMFTVNLSLEGEAPTVVGEAETNTL
jgi:hypothetical protein